MNLGHVTRVGRRRGGGRRYSTAHVNPCVAWCVVVAYRAISRSPDNVALVVAAAACRLKLVQTGLYDLGAGLVG